LRNTADHVWFKRTIIYFSLEGEGSIDESCRHSALQAATCDHWRAGWDVNEPFEAVKVRYKEDDRLTVGEIGALVPPVDEPAGSVLLRAASKQALLQILALAANAELHYSLHRFLKLIVREEGPHGAQVANASLPEVWHRQPRQRCLFAPHNGLGRRHTPLTALGSAQCDCHAQ